MSSLELQGFRASIASGDSDEKLALYTIEESEDGSAVTCWIASEEGKKFFVKWTRSHHDVFSQTWSAILLADNKASRPICVRANEHIGISVALHGIFDSENGSPTRIDDQRVDATPLDGLGDIKLEIWRTAMEVVGKGAHLLPCPETMRVRMFDEPKGEITETTKLDKHPIATFTFKYRPIAILQANGIVPRPVDKKRKSVDEPMEDVVSLTQFAASDAARDARVKALEDELRILRSQVDVIMVNTHAPAPKTRRLRGVPVNANRFVSTHHAELQRSISQGMPPNGVVQNTSIVGAGRALRAPEQRSQLQAGPVMAQNPMCGLQQGHPPTGMGLTVHINGMAIMNGATAQQRPRPEELHMASQFVAELEANFIKNYSRNMTKQAAPEQEKAEYIRTLKQAFHASQALYPKLPMFLCVLKDADRTKQLVGMILATFLQRNLVYVGIQERTLSLFTLRDITQQLHACDTQITAAVREFIPQPQHANEVPMEDIVSDNALGEPDAARDTILRILEDMLPNHLSQPSAPGRSNAKRAKVGPMDT